MLDQDAFEDTKDHFSFVVTIRKRDGRPLAHAPNSDLGHIRRAIISIAELHSIDVKLSGWRSNA